MYPITRSYSISLAQACEAAATESRRMLRNKEQSDKRASVSTKSVVSFTASASHPMCCVQDQEAPLPSVQLLYELSQAWVFHARM